MNRISIVGVSGSGKSTLANNLGKKLNLPVFHLDKYFFTTGWKERYSTKEEFISFANDLAKQDTWIIDGNYWSSLDVRLERSDTILFLDVPKWLCFLRVFKRLLNRKQPFDKAEGVKEKVDWKLVKWIWNYNTNEMQQRVLKYSKTKRIFILKNSKDILNLFNALESLST